MVLCSGCRKKMRQEAMPANLFISPWLSMNLATSKSYNCSQRMRIYHQWRYSRSLFHSLKTIPRRLWTFFFLTESSVTGETVHRRQGDALKVKNSLGYVNSSFILLFPLFFFLNLSHYGLRIPDRLPHKRIRPGIAKSNHFPVQADSTNIRHYQGLWGPQRKGYARPFKAPTRSYI